MRRNRAKDVRLSTIPDVIVRENIRLLAETVELLDVSIEWKLLEFSATIGGTYAIQNPLGEIPTDIILTWVEWTSTVGTFTWGYSQFTKDNIYYTCDQSLRKVRAIVGRRG